MTAVRVNKTKLFSEARTNILDLISDKTNVADPTTSSSQFRKWIYAREPDAKESMGFNIYPFIILHPSSPTIEIKGGSKDGKSKFVTWDIEIEIVTSDRGYNNSKGKGLSQLDAISDDIFETLNDLTNRNTLRSNALFFVNPKATDVITEIFKNELVFRRSIIIPMRTRMQVSA